MQANVITPETEEELEPQIRLWSIADYHQMIEAGILDENDHVELLEEKIVLQAFSDVAISLDAMFPIAENLQS